MMSLFTQRTAFSLGFAAIAFALAPAAQAQVQVTGGVVDGEAAFFTGGGQTSLFDLNITNMQVVSPNGVLSNPQFEPKAAGGFVDTDTSGTVTPGDTGLITGLISGIAYTADGTLCPFSQVDMAFAYNVSRFNVTDTIAGGFLVDGDSIPQLFFTADPGTVGSAFTKTGGNMEIGEFNSNITAGIIDLPSDVTFGSSSGSSGASIFNLTSTSSQFGTASRALADSDDEIANDPTNQPSNIAFNFGSLNLTFNVAASSSFSFNGSSTFTTSNTTSLTEVTEFLEQLVEQLDLDSLGNSATVNVFSAGRGRGRNVRFEIASSPTYNVRVRQNRRGDIKIKVKVKNRRGRRILIALRGDVLAGGFEQVGATSRAFPGLVGLRQLSDEEAAEILAEIQAEEAEEDHGDDGDDTDTDGDDTDTDDDDGDDDDDTDDDDSDDGDDDDDTDDDDSDDDGDDDDDTDDDDDDGDDDDDTDGDDSDDDDDTDGDDTDDDGNDVDGAVFEGLDSISDEDAEAILDSFGTTPADGTDAGATDDTAPADGTDAGAADDTAPADDTTVQ